MHVHSNPNGGFLRSSPLPPTPWIPNHVGHVEACWSGFATRVKTVKTTIPGGGRGWVVHSLLSPKPRWQSPVCVSESSVRERTFAPTRTQVCTYHPNTTPRHRTSCRRQAKHAQAPRSESPWPIHRNHQRTFKGTTNTTARKALSQPTLGVSHTDCWVVCCTCANSHKSQWDIATPVYPNQRWVCPTMFVGWFAARAKSHTHTHTHTHKNTWEIGIPHVHPNQHGL